MAANQQQQQQLMQMQQQQKGRKTPSKQSSPAGGKDGEISLAQTLRGVATPQRNRHHERRQERAVDDETTSWADVSAGLAPAPAVSLESALPAPLPPQQPWQNQQEGAFQPSGYREALRAKGERFFRHCPTWSHFLMEQGFDQASLMLAAAGGLPQMNCQWAAAAEMMQMQQMQQVMMPQQMMLSDALLAAAAEGAAMAQPLQPLAPLALEPQQQQQQQPAQLTDVSSLLSIALPGGMAGLSNSEIAEQLKAAAPCQYED